MIWAFPTSSFTLCHHQPHRGCSIAHVPPCPPGWCSPLCRVQGCSGGAAQAQTHPILDLKGSPFKKTGGGALARPSSALALHSPSSTKEVFGVHQSSPPAAAQGRDRDAQGAALISPPKPCMTPKKTQS